MKTSLFSFVAVMLTVGSAQSVPAADAETTRTSKETTMTQVDTDDDLYRAPETWARCAFRNLIYFHQADRGGHFAVWEHPEPFAAELRAAFKSLR